MAWIPRCCGVRMCRPAAVPPIQLLAWELPYGVGAALKSQKKKKLIYLLGFFYFFIFQMIFIFSIIAGLQCSVNFLLYSKVTQLHIHAYILFSHIIMLHHK